MAAVHLQVHPPEPFWDDAGDTSPNIRTWLARFENWLALTVAQLTADEKPTDEGKNRNLSQ